MGHTGPHMNHATEQRVWTSAPTKECLCYFYQVARPANEGTRADTAWAGTSASVVARGLWQIVVVHEQWWNEDSKEAGGRRLDAQSDRESSRRDALGVDSL